jgi:uncharacterized protein YoxC
MAHKQLQVTSRTVSILDGQEEVLPQKRLHVLHRTVSIMDDVEETCKPSYWPLVQGLCALALVVLFIIWIANSGPLPTTR